MIALLAAAVLSRAALAQEADDDSPSATEQRENGNFTFALGYGIGTDSGGFAVGIAGTLGGGPFSLPVYLVIADGGTAGGMLMIGGRYETPKWVFFEALVGYPKVSSYYAASVGAGGGLGVEIPLGKSFAFTAGGTAAFSFGVQGSFILIYGGPTLRL